MAHEANPENFLSGLVDLFEKKGRVNDQKPAQGQEQNPNQIFSDLAAELKLKRELYIARAKAQHQLLVKSPLEVCEIKDAATTLLPLRKAAKGNIFFFKFNLPDDLYIKIYSCLIPKFKSVRPNIIYKALHCETKETPEGYEVDRNFSYEPSFWKKLIKPEEVTQQIVRVPEPEKQLTSKRKRVEERPNGPK